MFLGQSRGLYEGSRAQIWCTDVLLAHTCTSVQNVEQVLRYIRIADVCYTAYNEPRRPPRRVKNSFLRLRHVS